LSEFDYFTLKILKDQINKKEKSTEKSPVFLRDKIIAPICRTGIAEGIFSGVAAGIFKLPDRRDRAGLVMTAQWGRTRFDKDGQPVTGHTLFDLASLTKPLATTLLTLHFVEQGRLRLDDPVARFLEVPNDKKELTISSLLSHSSGLSPYRPYYRTFDPNRPGQGRTRLFQAILDDPLEYPPGSESRYSDLGFILLGAILEKAAEQSLDTLFTRLVAAPLGLERELFFGPVNDFFLCAATEQCSWRGRLIQGEVHDEHCFLLGGVSGHAGLFGTVRAVLHLCRILFLAWQGWREWSLVSRDTLELALTRRERTSSWCLGFDTPSPGGSSSGGMFSEKSVGHLGFTGTSFWMDPEKGVIVVLLTNRVHPTRSDTRIRSFRPEFHDRIMHYLVSRG